MDKTLAWPGFEPRSFRISPLQIDSLVHTDNRKTNLWYSRCSDFNFASEKVQFCSRLIMIRVNSTRTRIEFKPSWWIIWWKLCPSHLRTDTIESYGCQWLARSFCTDIMISNFCAGQLWGVWSFYLATSDVNSTLDGSTLYHRWILGFSN